MDKYFHWKQIFISDEKWLIEYYENDFYKLQFHFLMKKQLLYSISINSVLSLNMLPE